MLRLGNRNMTLEFSADVDPDAVGLSAVIIADDSELAFSQLKVLEDILSLTKHVPFVTEAQRVLWAYCAGLTGGNLTLEEIVTIEQLGLKEVKLQVKLQTSGQEITINIMKLDGVYFVACTQAWVIEELGDILNNLS